MTINKIPRTCSIENCYKPVYGRTFCTAHYQSWRKYGDATQAKPRVVHIGCDVPDCDRPHEGLGLCKLHRERQKKYGNPLRIPYGRSRCMVNHCNKLIVDGDYCCQHGYRFKRYGTPLHGLGKTNEERFWSQVDKTQGLGRDGDCWEWRGSIARPSSPYGIITLQRKVWRAHRLSYMWATGHITDLEILHSCDNPRCVNPAHLRAGTAHDNAQDRVSRGRNAQGERHGMARLTQQDIKNIRQAYQDNISLSDIKIRFQVSDSHARGIIDRTRWRHVP